MIPVIFQQTVAPLGGSGGDVAGDKLLLKETTDQPTASTG